MSNRSSAIVGFIANLMPLYVPEEIESIWCARSMDDGTLIMPVDETGWAEERGTVKVQWQGDPARTSDIDGPDVATLAVVRYVRLHNLGQPEAHQRRELQGLAEHFAFKTGCVLYLPYPDAGPSLVEWVHKSLGRLGEAGLIEVLKKAAGL